MYIRMRLAMSWRATHPSFAIPIDTHRYCMLISLLILLWTSIRAFLMTPCHFLHFCFGKVLFAATDLLLGWLIEKILLLRGVGNPMAMLCACTWLFNPMSLTVSTRGDLLFYHPSRLRHHSIQAMRMFSFVLWSCSPSTSFSSVISSLDL